MIKTHDWLEGYRKDVVRASRYPTSRYAARSHRVRFQLTLHTRKEVDLGPCHRHGRASVVIGHHIARLQADSSKVRSLKPKATIIFSSHLPLLCVMHYALFQYFELLPFPVNSHDVLHTRHCCRLPFSSLILLLLPDHGKALT